MTKKILDWLDRQQISLGEWISSFLATCMIRSILENISDHSRSGFFVIDPATLVHYGLFYVTTLLGLTWIGYLCVGTAARLSKVLLIGFPIIWLAPSLDLISGGSAVMHYDFHPPSVLLTDFFTFLTPRSMFSPGLRTEILLIIGAAGVYVWACKKSLLRTGIAMLATYIWLFFMAALPALLYALGHLADVGDSSSLVVTDFLQESIAASTIASNSLNPILEFNTPVRAYETGFGYFMAQIYVIVICVLAAGLLSYIAPKKFFIILKNSRPERVAFYLLFLVLGMLLAAGRGLALPWTWVDNFGAISLAFGWFGTWMYAVHVNDIVDQPIDIISNTGRPLARHTLSVEEMRHAGYLWLLLSLAGTWSAGQYPFFLNLMFLACSHVYSAPPLRLKRVPILSSALIAGAVLCTFVAGYYFLSIDKRVVAFPLSLAKGVMLIITLGVNMRDIKDIEGDRAQGILTLPVLFGRYGTHVTGTLFALGFLVTPFILHLSQLIYAAVPAALAAYLIAIRKPYQEKWVFILYFCFLVLTVCLLTVTPVNSLIKNG